MEIRHPIRIVAERTGMSPHLIRMWERRYEVINPFRTATGRRLYSDEDIEQLALLRQATLAGQSISQIAHLTREQLRTLIPAEQDVRSGSPVEVDQNSVERHFNLCLQAMKDLDSSVLETRLLRASTHLGNRVFLEKLLHPLLETTGEMWSDGRLSVSHEHLASAVIRSLLGSMYLPKVSSDSSPLLISTTPVGQQHEFGALMALVTAASSGWRTLYLGANLPAEDIIETARARGAGAIALSIVYPPNDPELEADLRKLKMLTKSHTPILVGGRSASAYDKVLREIKAVRINGLDQLRHELDHIIKPTTLPGKGRG